MRSCILFSDAFDGLIEDVIACKFFLFSWCSGIKCQCDIFVCFEVVGM